MTPPVSPIRPPIQWEYEIGFPFAPKPIKETPETGFEPGT